MNSDKHASVSSALLGPVGGNREPTCSSSCCHCCPATDCHRHDASTQLNYQPVKSSGGAAGSRYFADAAPPALLQCMPVCTPQLLLVACPLTGHK